MVIRRNAVAVGDYCGKTFVIQTFIKDELPEPNLTFVRWDMTDVEVDGTIIELQVWDTCSKERFKDSRVSTYKRADVFLIFFTIYGRKTFKNVEHAWLPEIKKFAPKDVPIILVGTHCKDFTFSSQGSIISNEEAKSMAHKIGAVDYVECSADNKYNIEEVFTKAGAAALEYKKLDHTPLNNFQIDK